jgi:hypothetical protein
MFHVKHFGTIDIARIIPSPRGGFCLFGGIFCPVRRAADGLRLPDGSAVAVASACCKIQEKSLLLTHCGNCSSCGKRHPETSGLLALRDAFQIGAYGAPGKAGVVSSRRKSGLGKARSGPPGSECCTGIGDDVGGCVLNHENQKIADA